MDDEFAKALESLHSRVDASIQKSVPSAPVIETWHVDDVPEKARGIHVTYFLIVVFVFLFVCVACAQVYLQVLRKPETVPIKSPEVPNRMMPNRTMPVDLANEVVPELSASELEWIESIKRGPASNVPAANLPSGHTPLITLPAVNMPSIMPQTNLIHEEVHTPQPKKKKKIQELTQEDDDSQDDVPIDVEDLIRKREAQTKAFEAVGPPPNYNPDEES